MSTCFAFSTLSFHDASNEYRVVSCRVVMSYPSGRRFKDCIITRRGIIVFLEYHGGLRKSRHVESVLCVIHTVAVEKAGKLLEYSTLSSCLAPVPNSCVSAVLLQISW